jgi:hypothetical protein
MGAVKHSVRVVNDGGFAALRAICHALELSLTDVIEFSAAGPKRVDLGANAADGSRAALL